MGSKVAEAKDYRDPTYVRSYGIVALSLYLIAFVVLAVLLIIAAWPGMPPRSWLSAFSDEGRYILVVTAGGVLGSAVQALSSLTTHIGNRRFLKSWVIAYVSRVFLGGPLALIFYFLIRGGLISSSGDARSVNPFGMAAVACLVGMFSQPAVEKLSLVFDTLFKSEKPIEQEMKSLSTALGLATLDNYKGYLCMALEDAKGYQIMFKEATVLDADSFYKLVLWFQPEKPDQLAEKVEITGGNDSIKTEFTVAPNSDSFSLRPYRASISFDVTKQSPKEEFEFHTPKTADVYELWVEVSQKNRVIQVASLTFTTRSPQTSSS